MLSILRRWSSPGAPFWAAFLFLLAVQVGRSDSSASSDAIQSEKAYEAARKEFQTRTNEVEAAWQFGRACFDWAEFPQSSPDRAQIASEGINACARGIALESRSAPSHYYMGLNLGQLARTRKLSALKLVEQMELELRLARSMNEDFDYAGPDRALGLLYLNAPGWPVSIGSRSKAREHSLRAAQLHPEYPENCICVIEAFLRWNHHSEAETYARKLDKIWPIAKKTFTGQKWERSWAGWESRREEIKRKLENPQ